MNFLDKLKLIRQFLDNAAFLSGTDEVYKKGDFFKIPIPFKNIYLVNDPNVLKHILVKNESNYQKSIIYWQQLKNIIGDAMGSLEGNEWLVLRRLQKPHFSKKNTENYFENISDETKDFVDKLSPNFNPMEEIAHFNIGIILHYIFKVNTDFDAKKIYKAIDNGEDLIAWQSKFPWRKYTAFLNPKKRIANKSLKFLSAWANDVIKHKSKNPDDGLLYDLIKNQYPNKNIRNELIIHLGAGTETVAVALTWTLFLLSKHKDVLEKIKNDLDLSVQNQTELDYLNKEKTMLELSILESLRLYPPSHALVRDALGDDEIQNKKIKKNDIFYISAYGIHRNPKYWKNPNEFIPERFLNQSEFENKYIYIPFGAGKHSCIGRHFAMPLMKYFLFHFILKYEFKLIENREITPVSLSTLKPDRKLLFELNQRLCNEITYTF